MFLDSGTVADNILRFDSRYHLKHNSRSRVTFALARGSAWTLMPPRYIRANVFTAMGSFLIGS
ncbi:hypothetical protein EYZ11_005093 [Aspergillus tanneri]|uniref:Uncharacterized protein n=1 Tax=Aspergillus tanneri TaxID=1220188 RepID=A0A4S3JPR3_9EURO|nr:hypothetical protein EYZ11_005093 [Aspergillus tanneri]